MLQLKRLSFFKWIYFERSDVDRIIFLSCFFSIGLAITRVLYTGSFLYASLCWNLFLAFVPLLITQGMMQHISWIENKVKFVAAFAVWLLFIPNSFYIITDLFHLRSMEIMPLWFDLALIFSFAWNGLLLGILSVRQMEKMVRLQVPLANDLIFIYPIMWLNAFGIYLGRYLRFNTWDVLSNPFQLAIDIYKMTRHPVHFRFEWSMVFCFSILMTLMYATLKKISKASW